MRSQGGNVKLMSAWVSQVGVPRHVATTLTFPERVNSLNLARLQKAVLHGALPL